MTTFIPATDGLLLIANKKIRWTTNIPDTLIPTSIAHNIRQSQLQQIPTIIRSNTEDPKLLSRNACSVTRLAFLGLRPIDNYEFFRTSLLYTTHKLITVSEYRFQHERATTVNELPPPLQALLQILDAIKPATRWTTYERPNTVTFTPMDVDYNPFRLRFMPCSLYLTHHESPTETARYLIRPPRLRSDIREDNLWVSWWRTIILVESLTSLPMSGNYPHIP